MGQSGMQTVAAVVVRVDLETEPLVEMEEMPFGKAQEGGNNTLSLATP